LLAALVVAQPAAAKVPYFTVELQPAVPVPGAAATVVVRTFADSARTVPTEFAGLTTFPRLFCAYPPGAKATRPGSCTGGVWIDVQRSAADTLTGMVVFPSAGTWTLISFPEVVGAIGPGYPDRISVPVGVRGLRAVHHTIGHNIPGPSALVMFVAVGSFVVLAVAGVASNRRRTAEKTP